MRSRYDGSDRKWYGEGGRNTHAKGCRTSTMGQITYDMAKGGGGTYILKVQSKYDGQIANGIVKEKRTHSLKMQSGYDGSYREWNGKGRNFERAYLLGVQSGYDGSGREWHSKGRNDLLSEGAEWVRRVRSRMAEQRRTF